MLRIYLLGEPHVIYDGAPFELAPLPRTWLLWAYLLMHSSNPTRRETLAFAFWPDESPLTARANLRRHLYDLKRILPPLSDSTPEWLLADARTIRWNPDCEYRLDVTEFELLSASIDTTPEAVALYKGDFLESSYDDWLFYERERLRDLYLADLNQLALQSRAERSFPQAALYAQRMLEVDPFREGALRHLMSARYLMGDRSGALQAYEHFARLLREELGVEPMPETAALREAIIREALLPGETGFAEATLSSPPAIKPRRLLLPFVGREAEFEQLHGWWSRAARGKGGVILLGGEAGIGKTRLAAQLGLLAEHERARVLLGHATFAEPVLYQAVVEALRSALPLLAALEIEPVWLAAVASLLPELRTRRGEGPGRLPSLMPLDPERERTRLFEGIARCLEGLALPRPLLLILEDMHWAGTATANLLEFLARRVSQHALLIVVTYREEETPRAHPLRDLRRRLQLESQLQHLALGPLQLGALENMLAQMPIPGFEQGEQEALARKLYFESDGQPFFLSELIRELLEAVPGAAETADDPISAPTGAPHGVRTLIAARMARLSPEARSLAEVASVAGAAFTVEIVREMSGRSESQVLDSLDELLDRGFVSEVAGRSLADYAFTHHLIQAAIHAEIPPALAARRHRRLAQVMEEIYYQRREELSGELGLHFDLGNEPEQAAKYYLAAARRVDDMFASEDALRYISRALELSHEPSLCFDLLAKRESIDSRHGNRLAQQNAIEQMELLAETLADEDRLCTLLLRRILLQRMLGERQAEAEYIRELKQRAASSGEMRWQAEALEAEADYQVLLSQYDSAHATLERALALRVLLDDSIGQVECYALLSEVAAYRGNFEEAQLMLKQATSLAGPGVNQSMLVRTLRAASIAAIVQVEIDTAYKLGLQMLELCTLIGDREGEADAQTRVATAASRLFHVEEARAHYAQAAALYSMLGNRRGEAAVLVNAGMLAANLGHYVEAIGASKHAEALFKELNDMRGQTVSLVNIAAHSLLHGDYAEAQAAGANALKLARSLGSSVLEAYALANLGAAERERGELEQAIVHMEMGLEIRRAVGQVDVELATDLCDLTIAYLRAGRLSAAQNASDEMLGILSADAVHMTHPQYILWAAAQTYHALGDSQRAGDLLEEAYQNLLEKVAEIPDPESRATFVALSYNRELTTTHDIGLWP